MLNFETMLFYAKVKKFTTDRQKIDLAKREAI